MKLLKVIVSLLILLTCKQTFAQNNPWEAATSTYKAPAAAIGSYANGCLAGAQALPLEGEGYQVIRSQRQRYYGHPNLVNFISDYAKQLKQQGINNILVGDMSMPRGGQFNFGHSSHQIGLDVDIWLKLENDTLSAKQLAKPYAVSVVDKKQLTINKSNWKGEHRTMLKVAAQDERVARIFVSPVIKEQLCNQRTEQDDWLQKIRPWWGHTSHMHVRLVCPAGDKQCKNQKPIAKGHGCDELDWWKTQLSKAPTLKPAKKPKPLKVKPLPCEPLVQNLQAKQ
ncbi:penicillin-insensitive murein endopeptidase [Agarivorans sp. Toyoura001]|uniref:penicillin-insensitive murein endopeptidase n=1 Tax=unclassified Agarivorans TaxID=2636026 RepID=UPI0010EFD419|nr:penicillin-insensitive murein endopeptidase [Agarivorans sp. Toyoura001]GDY25818.1 penicillin-insensitive murein endopeptidase [Agarivorans sp. Toyoura001]